MPLWTTNVPVEKLSQSGVDNSIPTPYNKNVEEDNMASPLEGRA